MRDGITQQHLVPDEILGPLVESPRGLVDPVALRRSFADNGYVLLRDVLDGDEISAARKEVFARLAEMEEILAPIEAGIATGVSRRRERSPDLGAFWKSVR
jgi:hypothetical protein